MFCSSSRDGPPSWLSICPNSASKFERAAGRQGFLNASERRTEPGPNRSSNEDVLLTFADAGLTQLARSKSVTQAASPSATANIAAPNAASRHNRLRRLEASPADLVVLLSIRPRLGAV